MAVEFDRLLGVRLLGVRLSDESILPPLVELLLLSGVSPDFKLMITSTVCYVRTYNNTRTYTHT